MSLSLKQQCPGATLARALPQRWLFKGEADMHEQAIIKGIRATLERDTRINLHRYPVKVAVANGDLILSGEVEDIAAKKLILAAAAERPPSK